MRILYATDGSAGAQAAGCFLAALPFTADTHLHIITATNPKASSDSYDSPAFATTILTAMRATLSSFPGGVTTATVTGGSTHTISEAILAAASDFRADLIVLGASGHSTFSRLLLGSVSEAVVRHATVPVLIVRPSTGLLNRVLVGVDGSRLAEEAVRWVADFFPLPPQCVLDLVRVSAVPPWFSYPDATGAGLDAELVAQWTADEERDAKQYIQALAARLEKSANEGGISRNSIKSVETAVSVGSPADQLIQLAKERKASLMVVGSHGRSGVERFLLGSVSDRILRFAPCSVLVVRTAPPSSRLPELPA